MITLRHQSHLPETVDRIRRIFQDSVVGVAVGTLCGSAAARSTPTAGVPAEVRTTPDTVPLSPGKVGIP
jgi:hypothetical protein